MNFVNTTYQLFNSTFEQILAKSSIDSKLFPLSHLIDDGMIQSLSAWRLLTLARAIAIQVITPTSQVDKKALFYIRQYLQEHLYCLGPDYEQDALGMEHMLSVLEALDKDPDWIAAIKRIHAPQAHQGAGQLIRRSLLLKTSHLVHDYHAQQAALSALLTPLRQNVGSCFATAPAILIQSSQPLQFLADISQLFGIGSLKRTFSGIEYNVPLSIKSGLGSLLTPIFLSQHADALEKLGRSISLIEAFKAAGLLSAKSTTCTAILTKNLHLQQNPFDWITAEKILSSVLKTTYQLTEKDIENYKQQQNSSFASSYGIENKKNKACATYLHAYKEAVETFVAQTEHPLLKSWEFTLASFSEAKADASKWNLYTSLGFDPSCPLGIGEIIQRHIQETIAQINDELAQHQSHYDHVFAQIKSLETRIRNVSTEQEIKWLQAEYRTRRDEIERVLVQQQAVHDKGLQLASLLRHLMEFYLQKFPDYFQEVYDPQLRGKTNSIYDDTPAGFRLVYKHGRKNPTVWTWIDSAQEFIKALTSFFTTTEVELSQQPQMAVIQRELSDIITAVILAIKEDQFLIGSLQRLAGAYQEPLPPEVLDHLDHLDRTPWAYRSGSTMSLLVSTYYNKPTPPTEVRKWVESELELLVFYLDTLKELPLSVQKQMLEQPKTRGLLAFSPTHAFILKPGWRTFSLGWQTNAYTYSWVRDHWIHPGEAYWDLLWLEEAQQEIFLARVASLFPIGYQPIVKEAFKQLAFKRIRPHELRQQIIEVLSYEKWLKPAFESFTNNLDQLLYEALPLYPHHAVPKHLEEIWEEMEEIDKPLKQKLLEIYDSQLAVSQRWISAKQLKEVAQTLLLLGLQKPYSTIFYFSSLVAAMRKMQLLPPEPILFADPNWQGKSFGFLINPGNLKLEFWLLDTFGLTGRPMSEWKKYIDGRDKKDWGVYLKPSEYFSG